MDVLMPSRAFYDLEQFFPSHSQSQQEVLMPSRAFYDLELYPSTAYDLGAYGLNALASIL